VNGAINAYQKIREKEDLGIRPMHRPKNWERESRRKEKEMKRKRWYKDWWIQLGSICYDDTEWGAEKKIGEGNQKKWTPY
jgi:hypothetical protein